MAGPAPLALGVDFSSAALHCAYGREDQPFTIRLRIRGDIPEDRTASVYWQLSHLLDLIEARFAPISMSHLVLERPFLGRNPRTVVALGQLSGAIQTTAASRRWAVTEEDPSEIRRQVLGVGSAKGKGEIKRIAQRWVLATHGLAVDGDTADSIVIWHFARGLAAGTVAQGGSSPCKAGP